MDWQTLFALVSNNCDKEVPIEIDHDLCYVYRTQKKGFPFKSVTTCQKTAFAEAELHEIVEFLNNHGYRPNIKEEIKA